MTYQVQLLDSTETFQVEADESILSAALRAHIALPHDCQLGGCGACRIKLIEGTVKYDEYPMGLTLEEEAVGFALACQARAASDLVIAPGSAVLLPVPERHVALIKSVEHWTTEIIHLVLEINLTQPLVYLPGQYLNVHLEDGSVRSFSMASVSDGGSIDLHVRRVAGGRFTDLQLTTLKVGDTLDVELPLGSFNYRKQDYRPLLMVATGTGMAPIQSILESLMDDPGCPPVSVYWGMRNAADLYLDHEIPKWRDRLYDFQYIPVLSQPADTWDGRCGYVQDAVVQDAPDLSEYAIYLCGSPQMIRDAKAAFIACGASVDHIYADSFNFQHELAA